jgi:multiple sugar transport system permease protein
MQRIIAPPRDLLWRLTAIAGVAIAVALTTAAIASLAYLIGSGISVVRLSDFGVSCTPTTLLLTSLYVGTTVAAQIAIGVTAAILVFFWTAGRPAHLVACIALLTIPYAIPSTVAFTMFEFLVADGSTFQSIFLANGSPLNGTWSRFWLMTLVGIWQFFPFVFVLTLAAFLTVPLATVMSARSDGAGPYQITRALLLPAALPVIIAAIALRAVLMLTKVDAPLAFHATSSNDYACLAAVRIYTGMGLGVTSAPLGLVLLLSGTVLTILLLGHFVQEKSNR